MRAGSFGPAACSSRGLWSFPLRSAPIAPVRHYIGVGFPCSYISAQQPRAFIGAMDSGSLVTSCRRLKSSKSLSSKSDVQQEAVSQNIFSDDRWDVIAKRLVEMGESSPESSLNEGHWVKLICGASFEDVADVRNLSLIYTLAGVDCIDCAADSAIVAAVKEGITAASHVMQMLGNKVASLRRQPWVMISINDNEDPHFRKAEFNAEYCPVNCPRPCERICPASAIKFEAFNKGANINHLEGGVSVERCYGCGRCIPICPEGLISARSYARPVETVASLIANDKVDAVEIHTGPGHLKAFQDLISQLGSVFTSLKLIAVSVPDLGESMIPTLRAMYTSMQPFARHLNLWQLDGRPMSGDIGAGASRAAILLAQKVTKSQDKPPGYIQLAGGTNAHTATALRNVGLYGRIAYQQHGMWCGDPPFQVNGTPALVAGVAYGGYARKIVQKFLRKMEEGTSNYAGESKRINTQLELHPGLLADAVLEAAVLVDGIKCGRS
ncbi:hypothetical protein R1sor_027460 [Riccia sorocarpa]|uniref:4Fe-4S ferredoxin-type domain-containing protein n=1 Tax=Riccia sorocarpa TaxID=122646 RepID=A0ABD3GH45_9MARC